MFLFKSLPWAFWCSLSIVAYCDPSWAAAPSVSFDFAGLAECRDVTSPKETEEFPGEKIIELKLRVSVRLLAGDLHKVDEVRIEARDCDSRMRVHSFEPNTRLETYLSDDIQWSRTVEKGSNIGATLGGEAPVLLGEAVAHVTPSVSGGLSKREVITETKTRLAPKHVVVTSGTIEKEHGVFFKLRKSPHAFQR